MENTIYNIDNIYNIT